MTTNNDTTQQKAYINVIQHEDADGELRPIYDHIVETRGKLAEVHKVQSLNPQSIVDHMGLYLTIMFGRSPLKRYQREMMAVVVSAANACKYCTTHHGNALNHYWKDEGKVARLAADFNQLDLKKVDYLLCGYAQELTRDPRKINKKEFIDPLKAAGLDDRAILDAALVTSYFNFVNRMVLGLGVHLEADSTGFKYE